MILLSKSSKKTEKAAEILARELIKKSLSKKSAFVFGLEGELGAGKTTFAKGFAKGLDVGLKISSPTFVLMKSYKLNTSNHKLLFHIDAYRLKGHEDLIKLGIKEIFNDSKSIVLIEWSDRIKKILPKQYTKIHIDHISEKERKITVTN